MKDSQLFPEEAKPLPQTQAPTQPLYLSVPNHFELEACQEPRVSKPGTWLRSCQYLSSHTSPTLFSEFTGTSKTHLYRMINGEFNQVMKI